MSTHNDKCLACKSGELNASSGVIVYVCGTIVSQYATSRSATCHGIEAGSLRMRIAALEAHVARLEEALGCVVPSCNHLHHAKKHQHKLGEPCPVELLVMQAKEAKP